MPSPPLFNKKFNIISNDESGAVVDVVKSSFRPTGNFQKNKLRGEVYARAIGMDEANTKMVVVMATEGIEAAGKAMIGEFTNANGGIDYAAMRERYG